MEYWNRCGTALTKIPLNGPRGYNGQGYLNGIWMVLQWYFGGVYIETVEWYLNGISMVLGGIMANGI